MYPIINKIKNIEWEKVLSEINEGGHSIVPEFFSNNQCKELIDLYDKPNIYRKTVAMERYRFGSGEYKYFDYPLPKIIQTIRESVYPNLTPIANLWMNLLKIDTQFPDTLNELQAQCCASNQLKPTPLILKYGKRGFNTLHQDLYGHIYFPLQAVFLLNEPDLDFTGGEFVLTQQTPRTQSKAIVLKPKKGDMIILTTSFRPAKGTKGYYRIYMKHGVSEIHTGERYALGIIFHDAES